MSGPTDAEILAALEGAERSARASVPAVVPAPAPVARRVGQTRAEVLRAELDALQSEAPVAGVTRLPWPETWFHSRDPGEARACRRLWCDVLRAGIADAVGAWAEDVCRAVAAGASFEAASEAGFQRQMGWVGTSEFGMVCRLAGFEPEAVASRLRRGARDRAAFVGIVSRFRAVQEARGQRDRAKKNEGNNGA